SRPQELWAKADALAPQVGKAVRWHLVGHLQRNKVRRTLPLVSLIHSIDSERLLATIDAEWQSLVAADSNRLKQLRLLLEVNTSGETAKHGLKPDDVESLLAVAGGFSHVAVCGLMTMAALEGDLTVAARNFASLRELRDRLQSRFGGNVQLDELSMG